jgi:hypothetical protein
MNSDLLEVCAAGAPLAVLKMDEAGNIELKSTLGQISIEGIPVGGILLGGIASAVHPAVFGDVLMTWLNSHTHPTSVGPTGPPTSPPGLLPASALSQKVLLS